MNEHLWPVTSKQYDQALGSRNVNAVEIEEAVSELAALPFDRGEFAFQFLAAFGNKDVTLKRLRSGNSNASDVPEGVLQRNHIHIATCDVGKVDETILALRTSPKTASQKAKYILATDGQMLQAEDITSDDPPIACEFPNFHDHFGYFLPLAGITTVKQIRESSFDIKATGRLNKLYVELLRDNPDWAAPDRRPDMNHFMARLIFCFFAEDTDIFHPSYPFTGTVAKMSSGDHTITHEVLAELFRAMNTRKEQHEAAGIRSWARPFPYVNGGLFSGSTDVPRFSKIARSYLINIGSLDWKRINPDIFGSMIQAVADDDERGSLGMHYTSVPNILKVLNPLFLDDLREKLDDAGDNGRKLLNLRARIARIRVFDPACGSGNFLVIAYKEMRAIEAIINERRKDGDRRSDIRLTNFRGIELRDFPAEIARLALIIAEYQCDVLYRGQKEALAEFLPLNAQNWITCGNALRLDWLSICPPTGTGVKIHADDLFGTPLDQAEIDFENEGGETYICGNPQFKGARKQTKFQKYDLAFIFNQHNDYKDCDYVAGWFIKAAEFLEKCDASFAFVSTNSISQGEQVGYLWSRIYSKGLHIAFTYQGFKWKNNAANNAGVHCVIVGVRKGKSAKSKIYSEDTLRIVDTISPYLVAGPETYIRTRDRPLSSGFCSMVMGSMARDNGNLILSINEAKSLAISYPEAAHMFKGLLGSQELIHYRDRSCLWLDDADLVLAESIPELNLRINRVKKFRSESSAKTTQGYATIPHKFAQRAHQNTLSIIVAATSSENRQYLPADLLDENSVITNAAYAVYEPEVWQLAVLISKMHLVWVESVCGKLETRLRYSSTLGWNTFPVPKLTENNKADLTRCAEDILLAREHYFPATIADMYDPDRMDTEFPLVRAAHERNDETLERIYIGRRFKNDTERLEKLFDLYTTMTASDAGGVQKVGKKATR
jgi:hypothetical protein